MCPSSVEISSKTEILKYSSNTEFREENYTFKNEHIGLRHMPHARCSGTIAFLPGDPTIPGR